MKLITLTAVAGLAALVSACATPAADGSAGSANVAGNGEKLVCRSIEITGTRFPQKECKTAEAWAQYDAYTKENAKESTDKFQRTQSGASTNSGG